MRILELNSLVLTGQATSYGSGSALGDVEGSQHGRRADAQTGNEAADKHGGKVSRTAGGSLHDDTEACDDTGSNE